MLIDHTAMPITYDHALDVVVQPRPDARLEPCGFHERRPFGAVRAAARAVACGRHDMGEFVTDHFSKQIGLCLQHSRVETYDPTARHAASESGAQSAADLDIDCREDRLRIPRRPQ